MTEPSANPSEDPFETPKASLETPASEPSPTGDMHAKVVRGTFWSVLGPVAKNGLRLGSNILLSYLLLPDAFGLATLVNTLIIGLEMISDLGIETSIIQSKRGEEPIFLDTAFSAQLLRGVVLFLLSLAITWPAAAFFEQPELHLLVPVAGASALIRGVWPTKLHLLRRHLEVRRLAYIEIGSQAVGVLAMAAHAYVYRSVWALIIGALVITTVEMVMGHMLPGRANKFRWEPAAARELLGFGKWIFLSTMVTYLADRFSILASGKLVDAETLGVYGIATMLASLPHLVGGYAVNAVLLPALAKAARDDHEKFRQAFLRGQSIVLPLLMFATMGLILFSPAFFFLIYRENYHDAGWMVQLSMISVWFFYLQDAWSRGLLALGISRPLAIANVVKMVFTIGLSLLGFHQFDFPGLVIGAGLGSIAGHFVITFALLQKGLPAYRLDAVYTAVGLVMVAAGLALPRWLAPMVDMDWRYVSIGTGLLFIVPLGAFAGRRTLHAIRNR